MKRFQEVKLGSYGQGDGVFAEEPLPTHAERPAPSAQGSGAAAGPASPGVTAGTGAGAGAVLAAPPVVPPSVTAGLPGARTSAGACGPAMGTWQAPPVGSALTTRSFPVYTDRDERFVFDQHQRWSRVAAWLRTSVAAEAALRAQYVGPWC